METRRFQLVRHMDVHGHGGHTHFVWGANVLNGRDERALIALAASARCVRDVISGTAGA